MQYDVGDTVELVHEVLVDGVLTDATVAVSVTSPAGAVSNPTPSHPSTGRYRALVPAALAGPWFGAWDVTLPGGGTDLVPFQFSVSAQPAPTYLSLAEFKDDRRKALTADDDMLLRRLRAASRAIDRRTGRRFWLDTTASSRTYRVTGPRILRDADGDRLLVDDIGVADDLVVEQGDGISWTVVDEADYDLERGDGGDPNWPVTALLRPNGCWSGPQVRVTTRWGWPVDCPDDVSEASFLLTNRLYMRRESPEGVVVGSAEFGTIRVSRWDSDVEALLTPYLLR